MASDRLLTAGEVADLLGLTVPALYAMNSRGSAPPRLRFGRHVRYRQADVERWLESRMVAPRGAA